METNQISLEKIQIQKLNLILQKLNLKDHHQKKIKVKRNRIYKKWDK